ncbi:putative membrane protein [Paenibacillaceae bacterium GAS479]|nr:putative membrane protein [Paenibacillaceae bacterium GAS479]
MGIIVVVNLLVSIGVIVVLQLIGMFIFSWMTPFKDLEELKKGNAAVGLAMGGKFLGTAILLGVSSYTNHSIWYLMLWFAVGYACLLLAYWVFELATPNLTISKELQQGNIAVGILLAAVYVGTGFVVSSLII